MGYPHRIQGDFDYHFWTKATADGWLAFDADDRWRFLRLFGVAVVRFGWVCHMYAVLGTHAHGVIRTPDGNIGRGLQWLLGVYAQTFNRRHKRKGHLVAARYGAKIIESEKHALELCRYVPLNPVRAGLCDWPEQWAWSSYPSTIERAIRQPWLNPTWVLQQFGGYSAQALDSLQVYVREGMAAPELPPELDYLRGR